MKFKQILPISLLAVLSLTGCDTSSSEEQIDLSMKELYASFEVGNVPEAKVSAIWEKIDEALVGITGSDSYEIYGVDARLFYDEDHPDAGAADRMEKSGYEGYSYSAKMYDNNVIEVNLSAEKRPYILNEDESDLAFPFQLEEWSDTYTEDLNIWDDGTNSHMALVKNGDPADSSSFVKSVASTNVNLADYAAAFDGSLIADYKTLADSATTSDLPASFQESRIVSYAEKVAATPAFGENPAVPEHLVVSYFFLGSWFGLYSLENVWEDSEYAGYYLDRGEAWGVSMNISPDGLLVSSDFFYDQLIDIYYKDNNWKSGDSLPSDPLTSEEIAGLDLVREDVDYSSIVYGLTQTVYSTVDNGNYVLADLPDITTLREVTDFDDTYLFDPLEFGE